MHEPIELAELQGLLWNFARHRTVTTAARCGILTVLSDRTADADEVAADCALDPRACDKILCALVSLGVATRDDRSFALAPGLRSLFRPGPEDLTPFLEHSHRMYENWGENLEIWLRTGTWPKRDRSEDDLIQFAHAMRGIGLRTAREVVGHLPLEGASSALDLGGSLGHWAEEMCRHEPGLTVTVFDTPLTARSGEALLAGTPHGHRISFRGGDFFEDDLGRDFDLVLIASVLHQELAEGARTLIRRAAGALTPGGHLCLVDFRIDADRCGPEMGALFAVHMRDFGDTWTEADIRSWMEEAGLESVRRQDIGPVRWLITGRRPA